MCGGASAIEGLVLGKGEGEGEAGAAAGAAATTTGAAGTTLACASSRLVLDPLPDQLYQS